MARWLDLTRRQLPAMAAAHHWPIRLDHCFMRVCLDAAVGQPWYEVIRRPAVSYASADQLQRAVAVAEGILADPASLPLRNAESLRLRGKQGKKGLLF